MKANNIKAGDIVNILSNSEFYRKNRGIKRLFPKTSKWKVLSVDKDDAEVEGVIDGCRVLTVVALWRLVKA